jgi:hypothetical protein
MCADIIVAFAVALLFNMFGQMGRIFKKLLVFVACATLVVVYFINGPLTFIGSIDLSVWIMVVIMFDIAVQSLEALLRKKFGTNGG